MATDQFSINGGSDSFLISTRSHTKAAETVTITAQEYEELVQTKREYAAIRHALLSGGVDPTTLDILVSTNLPPTPPESSNNGITTSSKQWKAPTSTFAREAPRMNGFDDRENIQSAPSSQCYESPHPPTPLTPLSDTQDDEEVIEVAQQYVEEQPTYQTNYEDRSLVFSGLAPFTSLLDITKIVRGGAILNVYIRPKERMAHVSFVEHLAAEKFLIHAKRNGIYVRDKRLTVAWDERQSYLSGHIARRIACNGASRNLVIRFAKPDMTARAIREDLEHIYRLEVVDVIHENGHIFISTNSVSHAINAKTCLQSRFKYKNTKIDFYPDECDQFILPTSPKKYCHKSLPRKPHEARYRNRFELLRSQSGDGYVYEQDQHCAQ